MEQPALLLQPPRPRGGREAGAPLLGGRAAGSVLSAETIFPKGDSPSSAGWGTAFLPP